MHILFNRLRFIGENIKHELRMYQLIMRDKRTPKVAKVLLGLAVFYALLPFDIIPDFIPVIGHLDDFIIVPVLIIMALKMIPREVVEDCKVRASVHYNVALSVHPG